MPQTDSLVTYDCVQNSGGGCTFSQSLITILRLELQMTSPNKNFHDSLYLVMSATVQGRIQDFF